MWLNILIITLSVVSIFMAFTRRLPSAVMAFVTFLILYWTLHGSLSSSVMWFWGIAAAIVTVNSYLTSLPPVAALRYFVIGGGLVGTAIGAVAGMMSAVILGGGVGAMLGWLAFTRRPDGAINAPFSRKLMLWADIALPALVTFYIIVLVLFQLYLIG